MMWLRVALCSLLVNSAVFSEEIRVVGSSKFPVIVSQAMRSQSYQSEFKLVSLLEFELSDQAQDAVFHRVLEAIRYKEEGSFISPSIQPVSEHVQLGMNKVPVLDQGPFGTCATFAVTAAIDAELKKGDYVSQLCLLQLGKYLEEAGRGHSGWSGSNATAVLNKINTYGIINMKNQNTYGCGGVMHYPTSNIPGAGMLEDEYLDHSESISTNGLKWSFIRRNKQLSTDSLQMSQFLEDAKAALKAGHRLVISVLFPTDDTNTIGAVGWHHYFSDTWVITADMAKKIDYKSKMVGHMMIITGYDDDAIAMDSSGHRHHGLFTLRNSWGTAAGDWGDYYMSYDFFKALAVDAYQISITS